MKNGLIYFVFTFISLLSCTAQTPPPRAYQDYHATKTVFAKKAVVSTAHPLATHVGLSIMKRGGNAVDAAVAVQFALAVVYPRAGNIGGGGFMVYRAGSGSEVSMGHQAESMTLDYREKAAALASRDMYLDGNGNVMEGKSQKGALAAGVPGTVDGCVKMYQRYSKLKSWRKLVQPAIDLAQKGFAITELEATRLNQNKESFQKYSTQPTALVKPMLWKKGDILRQPDLARTLIRIRDKGEAGFYEGETANLIVAEMQRGGGIISKADLKNYDAVWRKPLMGKYRGYELITMPPPSSGGVALLQMLQMIEPYPLQTLGFHRPPTIHLMVEAERRAFADRAEHLGDADFYPVKVDTLINKKYVQMRFKDFDPLKATPSKMVKAGDLESFGASSEQTTHISIVDATGTAVSITTTLNDNFGCRTVVGGAGFLLNNEMDDFSVKPGVPNLYGAIGGEANAIAPQKRMLSSMTPTIVTKDGKLYLIVGTPGGTTIITSVFQMIVHTIDFNMTVSQAVQARRFHSQWSPDILFTEKDCLATDVAEELRTMGHILQERSVIGAVEAIMLLPNGLYEGAADTRSDDSVEGF